MTAVRARGIHYWIAGTLVLGVAATAQETRAESQPTRTFHPSARWIWDADDPKPVDGYRLFRKSFALAEAPPSARLRISADAEYRLFVNGSYVGRGPAPSPAGRAAVDEHDVSRHAVPGDNVIAVIVHHLGLPGFERATGRGGVIAELEAGSVRVVTDTSWRVRGAWWAPAGVRLSPMRGFVEHLDARREPVGWANAGFDDAAWGRAIEIGPEGTAPWIATDPRGIALPFHRPSGPPLEMFAAPCPDAVPPLRDLAKELARMPADNAGGAGVVRGLDFGRELSGFPEIDVESTKDGVVVDLGYGEAIDAGKHVSADRQGYSHCDRLTLRAGRQTLRIFQPRAFRYLVIAVRGAAKVHGLRVIESGFPTDARGKFACSDPVLDRIWKAGADTTALCMDQGFMDCPWRERGQYVGDVLVQARVARDAFGDTTLARRFLRQARWCQPEDGLLPPAYPNDWIAWMGDRAPNRIPGYGARWVVLLAEHDQATGDRALVRELMPVVKRQLAWFDRFRGPDGLLGPVPEWNFIDWADVDPVSALASLNLQLLWALQSAARLDVPLVRTSKLGEDAQRMAAAFQARQWNERRGLYRDAEGLYSAHTNVLALLTLVEDPAVAKRIFDNLKSPGVVQPASPYFDGYLLRAFARWGRHEDALRLIRERWGPMIRGEHPTLWETYTPNWSLCHGWSSEPTAFLQREILGLSCEANDDALARTVRYRPSLAGLAWVEGTSAFPCGDVHARCELLPDGLRATIDAPDGVRIDVTLHAAPGARLAVDGEESDARAERGTLHLELRGGAHELRVTAPK